MTPEFTDEQKKTIRKILYKIQDRIMDDGYSLDESIDEAICKHDL